MGYLPSSYVSNSKNELIKRMLKEELSRETICIEVGVSMETVERIEKQLKKQ